MIDLPDRAEPRFPASLEDVARGEIKKRLQQSVPASEMIGFAS
jgi:hypothetical protein